jgi:hypothetical protein
MKAKPRIWHLAAIIAYVAVILGILHELRPPQPPSTREWLAAAGIFMLIPCLLAGPIRAIGQFSQRGELYAGEILWLWVGAVLFPFSGGDTLKSVGLAILSLILAIGVAVFGVRPRALPGAWAHYFGWVVFWLFLALLAVDFAYDYVGHWQSNSRY